MISTITKSDLPVNGPVYNFSGHKIQRFPGWSAFNNRETEFFHAMHERQAENWI
jgi:hypothetical protein